MKFGRVLRETAGDLPDLPELQALFSAYKHLKKAIKRLPAAAAAAGTAAGDAGVDAAEHPDGGGDAVAAGASSPAAGAAPQEPIDREAAEAAFVAALGEALAQMNDLFLEKEEDSVIRVEQLEAALAAAGTHQGRLRSLHREFVDFHGEVLLLVHWSILAYTATVKILKKHHKRTGLLLRAPLGNLLSQPFCSTEMMTDIAHRVEADIRTLCDRIHAGADGAPMQSAPADTSGAQGPAASAPGPLAPRLSDSGLDLALLQRLADSAGLDSPTSSASGHEGGGQQAGDAAVAHPPDAPEVGAGDAAAAPGAVVGEPAAGGVGGGAVVVGDVAQVRRAAEGPLVLAAQPHDPATSDSACSGKDAVGPSAAGAPPAKRARLEGCCGGSPPAAAGPGGLAAALPPPCCATGGRACSILRQAQVALTTWEHLITSASTPSTVMAQPPSARAHTHTTESSAA